MGQVTRKPQEKHKVSLSPAVSELAKQVSTVPYADLPAVFAQWPQTWLFPRGDLNNWIEPLDRFDDILKSFSTKYGLDKGPQTIPFGSSLLVEGSPAIGQDGLKERGFGSEGDRELIEAILAFSKLLVEKCANRTVYNSSDRLNDLLNTTSLSLLHSTLRITVFLAQRYGGLRPPANAHKFYDFDHERLQRLASPLGQLSSPTTAGKRGPPSPAKSRSKDKLQPGTKARRGSVAVNPNDFRSLCRDGAQARPSSATPDRDWSAWSHVKLSWSAPANPEQQVTTAETSGPEPPSTPTPTRQSSGLASRSNDDREPKAVTSTPATEPTVIHIDLSPSDLAGISIEDVLREQQVDEMPAKTRYELLHQLRIAYGLTTSSKTRQELLAIRLLAVASLANVFNEPEFCHKVFAVEKPQEFVQQIVGLLHDTKKGHVVISMYLQTLAMETIAFLAHYKAFSSEITAALGAGSNQGLLSQLIQRGLNDLAQDHDATDNITGDEWRDAIFSMPRTLIEATGQHGRSSEAIVATSFVKSYLTGFEVSTGKAMRVHLRMLDFIKTFFHHFRDGLATLLTTNAFEVIGNLVGTLTTSAWDLLNAGKGIPAKQKTRATDYEIPYLHQQIIRSVIDMINDISGHQGAQADRVLRSLVDCQALLRALRSIVDNLTAFGAHTWGEVIKATCGFLHNEPTSYTVISEAGIIQSILDRVNSAQPTSENSSTGGTKSISSAPMNGRQDIPPVADAIINISQAFSAICLTSAGFDLFKASGALEKFFEIFESPAHVKVLGDGNILAMLGSTFDELIRHHPNLRNAVLSAVMVMLGRVRHISRSLAVHFGAGAKLFLGSEDSNELIPCGGRESLSLEVLPLVPNNIDTLPVQVKIDLPNGDKLILEDEILPPSSFRGTPSDQDNNGLTATDYARPAVAFLMNFFEHQAHCNSFLEHGGCDLVLDFITLPSIPAVSQPFDRHGGLYQELASTVHMMAECKPHIVLPALADRTRFACTELQHFSQNQPFDWSCYFEPLVKAPAQSAGTGKSPAAHVSEVEISGTRIVKSMMAVLCLARVLGEVFHIPIYNQRHLQNGFFGAVNLEDVLADIVKMLGAISAACCREDLALGQSIRKPWLAATQANPPSTGNGEIDQLLSLREIPSQPFQQTVSGSGEDTTLLSDQDAITLEKDKQTPFFKNVQTLKFLLTETPTAITDFLCRLGRNIAARRRPDTLAKQKIAMVADALASAYLTQLEPYFFLKPEETESENIVTAVTRFTYLVVALANVRRSFHDDSNSGSGPAASQRQGYVVEAFRKVGGIQALTKIGTGFFEQLKTWTIEHGTYSAGAGLKICLDILDDFTDTKSIMDSTQSYNMKNNDPSRSYYFVPAQVLLNLRMEALPLTRLIWESEYTDQASKDVVQKLVAILKHVLNGDNENEAIQTDNAHPSLTNSGRLKEFPMDQSKVDALTSKGYTRDLAFEALYRTNSLASSSGIAAEEYCRAMTGSIRRRRLPTLGGSSDKTISTGTTPSVANPPNAPNIGPIPTRTTETFVGGTEGTIADVQEPDEDDEMEDIDSEDEAVAASTPVHQPATAANSVMDIHNLLNDDAEHAAKESSATPASLPRSYSVESITADRALIRDDLAERCNNILNNHQSLTFELSDLIISATKKLNDEQAKDYWRTTSDLLTSSLLSMQVEDDITEAQGKKVAAAAHLVALLIQDGEVFKDTLSVFQDSYEGLLSFLTLPAANGKTDEGSYPWVGPILLILEKMLSRDCEPSEVEWTPPNDLDSWSPPALTPVSVLGADEKLTLFDALINLLPRVGKDKGIALAIARVLVGLTRTRELATRLAEKRNLQRLFLMVKQLANGVGHRLQSSFMLILRHIVEDDEILRQIMRSEIKALFHTRSTARPVDTNSYLRELYHLVLRSPAIFVEVTKETVRLSQWQPASGGVANVVLKETPESQDSDATQDGPPQPEQDPPEHEGQSTANIEEPQESIEKPGQLTAAEVKPPVVEHPDGVIHFILSELLNYKDVEDKDVSPEATATNENDSTGHKASDSPTVSAPSSEPDAVQTKPEKPKFKPEEHPIFSYRCFLMYSLTELLHSYSRTKVEFINFSRKADPLAVTPSKPRSGILNYFLNGLIPSCYVDKEDSLQFKKKLLTSDWAIRVVVALCSKTGESGTNTSAQRYSTQPQIDDADNEPDLTFVRRFVLEHAIKAYKDAIPSPEPVQMKYSRLLCLADMFNRLLTKPAVPDGTAGAQNTSYKVLARMMFEKNLVAILTGSLLEINLAYPGSKRVIKFILRPLQELTTLATQLSVSMASPTSLVSNISDDVISSATSVSDVDEEREETPDLFRNSALGMLDPNRHDHESDSEENEDGEDEEMYDDQYEDEMEYDNGIIAGGNDDEAVSDEDEEDDMGPDGDMEGLPGDIPMDIEFVVDDPGMDIDSDDDADDDDEEESDEDDEDDDEDEDGEDFEIGEDDDVGEIVGDDENHSLNDDPLDEEGEWEDQDDEDGAEDDGALQDPVAQLDDDHFDFGGDIMAIEEDGQGGLPAPGVLSNLLRVLGDQDLDDPTGLRRPVPPELIIDAAGAGDPMDEEDEEDDDPDEEELDENGQSAFERDFELLAHEDHLLWDHPPTIRRHRQLRGPGSWSLSRRADGRGDFNPAVRSGRLASHGRAGGDDGTNPLLRRPQPESRQSVEHLGANIILPAGLEAGIPGLGPFPPLQALQSLGAHGPAGHAPMLDAIFQAIQRGEIREGEVQFRIPGPLANVREAWRSTAWDPHHHRHAHREDTPRSTTFVPALTMTRWQEEARLLFGSTYPDKLQRVQIWVTSVLVPFAQEEEKERRSKCEEELRLEREEAERVRAEAEQRKKETEEREEQERLRSEAEAAAAAAAESHDENAEEQDQHDPDSMEDVQGTDPVTTQEPAGTTTSGAATSEARPRVFTTIRGRELDITGLDIDIEYLEALPEDLREEVIMQQYATRRAEARQEGAESSEIDPDFMNALPEEIREELRREEAQAQRRRERDESRRQAVANGGATAQAEEMDNDNFLATLDPAFRRVILAEQPPEILRQLDPRHAAEGRAHARRLYQYVRGERDPRDDRTIEDAVQRDSKRQIIQMVDKAGVATLLRLMFMQQHGSLKTNLWHVLRNICGNRLTRSEVVNLLLTILKEGSTDALAVERSLTNLTWRAKTSVSQKTPLKRTISMPDPSGSISNEVTPLVVVQQCLSALKQLCQNNYHTRTLFVREVDGNSSAKKGKGKGKDVKTVKYPINDLLGLLDRKLIVESSSCLQLLAELLSAVTQPLPNLLKKNKEKTATDSKTADTDAQTTDPSGASGATAATLPLAQPNGDVDIQDAPPAVPDNEPSQSAEQQVQAEAAAALTEIANSNNEDLATDESKSKKAFEPPVISEHNLQLVASIFVAPECNSDTFHSTLETLSSLSSVPGTSAVFSRELIRHIQELSESIWKDLDDLMPQLRDAQSITDLHVLSSTKFSHSGSDQVKLLRVLQALDYLSAPKPENDDSTDNTVAKSVLTASYESLTLKPLWTRLSDCLTTVREKENIAGFATILLPLIESLMVVCKNTSLKDSALARQVKEQAPVSPTPETMDDLQELFFNFTTEHRKILNDIIRQSPKLMQGNGSFSLLVKNPKVLDFDNKRAYFTKQIHSRLHQQRHIQPPLQLNVRRDQIFLDSYKALYYKSAEEMKYGKLNIRFNGEEGVDAGGVTREWFQVLARGMFNPDWALWQPVAADRTTFHPSPLSWINGEHLLYFKFIGRIIGKALHEGRVLDCHFSRAVYKRILGKEPNLKDLESMDLDYYKSLVWILENDITDVITEDFSVIEEQFGEEKVIDLIPNGRNIPVTEENKREYVNAQVRYRLTTSVTEQIENFVKGFHDIIPAELVAIFDEQELELLISGLPEIDVDDWKAHTEYHNYNGSSPQVTWFWRVVRGMSNEERAKLLQFVTGTSKVPLNGFKDLEGMQGNTLFSIHKDPSQSRLPTSHTCFNQLDLPAYDDYDTLKNNLMTAINLGADYFGFA